MTQSNLPGMLQTVARLYYTGIGRRYKRASVQSGPGEPLCLKADAENAIRQAVFMAVVEERNQLRADIESLRKDAGRWRLLRDRCVWMTFLSPDLVRLAFRVPVQWTRVIETGGDLDALADAALAQTNVEITGLL